MQPIDSEMKTSYILALLLFITILSLHPDAVPMVPPKNLSLGVKDANTPKRRYIQKKHKKIKEKKVVLAPVVGSAQYDASIIGREISEARMTYSDEIFNSLPADAQFLLRSNSMFLMSSFDIESRALQWDSFNKELDTKIALFKTLQHLIISSREYFEFRICHLQESNGNLAQKSFACSYLTSDRYGIRSMANRLIFKLSTQQKIFALTNLPLNVNNFARFYNRYLRNRHGQE